VVDDSPRVHLEPVQIPGPTCSLSGLLGELKDDVDADSDCGSERSDLEDIISSSEDEECLREEDDLTQEDALTE
jgi:hypothetical protein